MMFWIVLGVVAIALALVGLGAWWLWSLIGGLAKGIDKLRRGGKL